MAGVARESGSRAATDVSHASLATLCLPVHCLTTLKPLNEVTEQRWGRRANEVRRGEGKMQERRRDENKEEEGMCIPDLFPATFCVRFSRTAVAADAISASLAPLTSLSRDPQLLQSIDHDSRPATMTLSEAIRLRILGLWAEVTAELPPDASVNERAKEVLARVQCETGQPVSLSTVNRVRKRSLSPAPETPARMLMHENPELQQLVKDLVDKSPDSEISCRKLASRSGLSRSTVHLIMRKGLQLFPYRLGQGQTLEENHVALRLHACQTFLARGAEDDSFWKKIIFSDEAYITLDRHVNSQNDMMSREKGATPGVVAIHVAHPVKSC